MTYRPYPNAARALRQLDRHTRPESQPRVSVPPIRIMTPEQAARSLEAIGAAVRPISEAMERAATAAARRVR
ncbi:hypothetical protein GCM10010400_69910 [Streptomyces aculeolatus]|uniref:hypothetical protein n=1 Tax=Streptomyces aculeolatus TaxID=270689 RepID=UPI001CEC7A07|nr:hypothetical protein [Streptomyces aculeolatus]